MDLFALGPVVLLVVGFCCHKLWFGVEIVTSTYCFALWACPGRPVRWGKTVGGPVGQKVAFMPTVPTAVWIFCVHPGGMGRIAAFGVGPGYPCGRPAASRHSN